MLFRYILRLEELGHVQIVTGRTQVEERWLLGQDRHGSGRPEQEAGPTELRVGSPRTTAHRYTWSVARPGRQTPHSSLIRHPLPHPPRA